MDGNRTDSEPYPHRQQDRTVTKGCVSVPTVPTDISSISVIVQLVSTVPTKLQEVTMVNVILPGTYITVRDEGLISVGGISTGNIGIVGSAVEGDINKVFTLSSLTDAKDIFGPK